jgi:hypothetical protein
MLKPPVAAGKDGAQAGVVDEEGPGPLHDAVDESQYLKDDNSFDARATLKSFLQFFN